MRALVANRAYISAAADLWVSKVLISRRWINENWDMNQTCPSNHSTVLTKVEAADFLKVKPRTVAVELNCITESQSAPRVERHAVRHTNWGTGQILP